jgi:lipopolysaccharide/colanic/teichoic acid biosynthesis glycosyltransferase
MNSTQIGSVMANDGMTESFAPSADMDGLDLVRLASRLTGTISPRLSASLPKLQMYDRAKRFVDLIVSSVVLVLFSPVFAVIAVLVKATSSGPALFRQERVGQAGRLFAIYKFRSMFEQAPSYQVSPSTADDPRITGVGRFLRRTSLDELPQFINVFLGQMSLVGPRPEMPFIVAQYNDEQRRRLSVKPGITGLWQISPHRGYPIHHHLEYDLYYLRHRSLMLDAAILLRTFLFAARGV